MSRTREDILEDIEHSTKETAYFYEKAEKYTRWHKQSAKWLKETKQELKAFDEANK
jgi:hypothetical protein